MRLREERTMRSTLFHRQTIEKSARSFVGMLALLCLVFFAPSAEAQKKGGPPLGPQPPPFTVIVSPQVPYQCGGECQTWTVIYRLGVGQNPTGPAGYRWFLDGNLLGGEIRETLTWCLGFPYGFRTISCEVTLPGIGTVT